MMVIAAHPDDKMLGAGATLARHASVGDQVHACVLAEGATSRYEDQMVDTLHECGKRAGDMIGFSSLRFDHLPDQRLDALPLIEVTQRTGELVDTVRPEIIYSHFPWDVNSDHGVVARCVWTACRPYRFRSSGASPRSRPRRRRSGRSRPNSTGSSRTGSST